MLKRRFVYSIEGFSPRTDIMLGGFGFSVYLDREFAKLAYQKELPEGHHLDEIAESILIGCGLAKKGEKMYTLPYNFLENDKGKLTSLVQWINVPGNACDLGADHMEVSELKAEDKYAKGWIEYHHHNVDSHL